MSNTMENDTQAVEYAQMDKELFDEAKRVLENEPSLGSLLHRTVLEADTFEHAVARTVCYRLLLQPCQPSLSSPFCPHELHEILRSCFENTESLEAGHTMASAVREDCAAVCRRDPAMDTLLQVVLFSKGFASLVCHRAARQLFLSNKKYTALFLQSQCSAVFGVDIHPAATIGSGVMLDHGTGIVIGETATVGDGCTLLHGVTLGGTGKEMGDRHPKVGPHVLIGAGSSLLGNIRIGASAKIGAGSVVLREIPAHATAVGAPAKIIGRANDNPGSDMDETLNNVSLLHKSASATSSLASVVPVTSDSESEESSSDNGPMCPWREYKEMAKLAPAGTITLPKLWKAWSKSISLSDINDMWFALDTSNVGYVHRDVFQKMAPGVIGVQTKLDAAAVQELLAKV